MLIYIFYQNVLAEDDRNMLCIQCIYNNVHVQYMEMGSDTNVFKGIALFFVPVPEFPPGFKGDSCCSILVFCVLFCRLFVILVIG